MCGRVNITDQASIAILMETIGMPNYSSTECTFSENLFPYYKPLLAGFVNEDQQIDTALMNWGWLREWDKDKRLFNSRRVSAKGQVIWKSPVWGEAIRKRRCLIPINAFYEWNQNQTKGRRDRYRVESLEPAMCLGGIFEINTDGEMFLSICTTEANEKMAEIHHRMPVIIDKKNSEAWLRSDNEQDIDQLMWCRPDEEIIMTKEIQPGRSEDMF
jgi:putative SOS response-associated peptidase YedK